MTTSSPPPAPTCFLDTETTSVRHDREVWELGLIRREPDQGPGEGQAFEWYLPVTLEGADRYALNVGGFYDRHPYGRYLAGRNRLRSGHVEPCSDDMLPFARDRHEKWRTIAGLLHGAHIVGAVPSFDAEAIASPLYDADAIPAHDYHLVDVGTLAAGWLAGQGKPVPPLPWRSGDIAGWVGVTPTPDRERHQALADARLAMRIYDRVVYGATS